jgi:hypothetical protein
MARVSRDYNLAVIYPKLARQWHPTRNGSLTPRDVTPYSNKRMWWICKKGHEWRVSVSNRAQFGTGCPYCSGKKVCADNSLEHVAPGIADQWHPVKNVDLTPKDVPAGSNKRLWWICRKGHEWQAKVSERRNGSGCPYCLGKRASKSHNLQIKNPRLAAEWHPTKNGKLRPKDVTPKSSKKVWWMCEKGHQWQDTVLARSKGKGCPHFQHRKVSRVKVNCLATIAPEIAKQWHPRLNGTLTPKYVKPSSNRKVWWICHKGHVWQARVSDRRNGSSCPYCLGRRATKERNLQKKNPRLAAEWHPTKNGELFPRDVTPGSAKKVWWICANGHEWEAVVARRKKGGTCPYCEDKKGAETPAQTKT